MAGNPAPWLAGGIAGVLLLGSVIGALLKARIARGEPHAVIDNVNARIRSWWLIAAIFGAALWAGTPAVYALFTLVSLLALREFLAAPFNPGTRPSICRWLAGIAVCVLCVAHIPALLALDIPGYGGRNAYLLLYFVLVAQASDVLQYLWGKWLGKHLITPAISPSKTIEGFIGGILCATALGAGLWWITPFSQTQAALVSLLITLLGFAGGVILSAQKRARGIKDWSNLIPGHGGMLDRVDSLWLAAPPLFYIVKFGWAAG
jgi:phosphatidate cytidylyltransferase